MERSVPDDFEQMWSDLAPVGRSSASGGYFRQPFAGAERELAAWFVEQADGARAAAQRDPSATSSRGGTPASGSGGS